MPGGKPAGEAVNAKKYSRRDFLVTGGTVVAVDALMTSNPATAAVMPAAAPAPAAASYPVSKGYLVYDSKKCAGCTTCMLACSKISSPDKSFSAGHGGWFAGWMARGT